jgi:hypothetical protein
LFVAGVGVPLLLDPTVGVIARADLPTIENRTAVPSAWIIRPSTRIDYDPYASGRNPACYTGLPADCILPSGASARGSSSINIWSMNSFASDVILAIHQGSYSPANLLYFVDTSVQTSLSGGVTCSAAVGRVGHALYALGPGAAAAYVNWQSGVWMTLPSGVASLSVDFALAGSGRTTPQGFSVSGGNGSTWSINLEMSAWQGRALVAAPRTSGKRPAGSAS